MDIDEILGIEAIPDRIKALKSGRTKEQPPIEDLKKQWEVSLHRTITDKFMLPDKEVATSYFDDNGKEVKGKKLQPVNRIALPLQKKIVNTAVSFAFGNPVLLNATPIGESQQLIFDAVKKLTPDCKLNAFSRIAYRELLRATEFAELWYVVPKKEHEKYGFKSKLRVKVSGFHPFNGDKLFPYFDETGELIAFSREFARVESNGKRITYFETYTDALHILWVQDGAGWRELKSIPNKLGKIPIVWGTQEAAEWADVQICIERLEFLLSKFAETNDYHASPTVFINGKIISMPSKGESGKVIQGDEKADAKYLSWDNAPEAIKLEIETLLRFIHGLTQTPDISFDSVKGLSAISGVALKMLFMDAHLKVQEKKEILDEFLQRRVNIQKSIIGMMAGLQEEADELEIIPEIVPYMIDDEESTIQNIMTATGGKPILSQKTGIKVLKFVEDTDAELAQIQSEAQATMFEPTNF